jgi:sugar phosphate isomerase/epimerase
MFAKNLGLRIAYHNEKNDEGEKELEALLAATDVKYVSFLLDAGHAYLSGMDVPAFLHKHSGKIIGIHLRDFRDGSRFPSGKVLFHWPQLPLRSSRSTGMVGSLMKRSAQTAPKRV